MIELILERGVVIDAFARLPLAGVEHPRLDVRVVIASVETFLRYAETMSRLELQRLQPEPLAQWIPAPPRDTKTVTAAEASR